MNITCVEKERERESARERNLWHSGHCRRLDRHPKSCFCNDPLNRKHGNGKSLSDSIPICRDLYAC